MTIGVCTDPQKLDLKNLIFGGWFSFGKMILSISHHGLRYTMMRGLEKVKMQATFTFACMNLKKLAIWKPRKRLQKSPVNGKNMAASVDNSLPYLSTVCIYIVFAGGICVIIIHKRAFMNNT